MSVAYEELRRYELFCRVTLTHTYQCMVYELYLICCTLAAHGVMFVPAFRLERNCRRCRFELFADEV